MEPSQYDAEPTGVSAEVYALVLVLQQALEDTVRYRRCAAEAAKVGDSELEGFFAELSDSDRDIVQRAQGLLVARLPR